MMNQTYEMLMAIKKVVELDGDFYQIFTINKKTLWEGCASFHTNGDGLIRVYEGSDDGSNDHSITIEEFLNNYQFELGRF